MKIKLRNILRLLRPRQWLKNFAVFGAITFSGELFNFPILSSVIVGFFIFCALSSAIYVINDIFDIEKDRLHPFKKFRPLPSGDISIGTAKLIAAALCFFSLAASYFLSPSFLLIAVVYLVLNFSYSSILKNIEIIDILAIAGGYILRVYAGEFVSGFHISVWLLLTTISLSLFLAVGKRRSELTLISQHTSARIAATRKTLSHYSERLLDVYASIFATSTFISYSLFTFLSNSNNQFTNSLLLPEFLPDYLQRKWLMITIAPVVYGLLRYLQDIYERHEGESPERVIFSDKPLLATLIIWIVLVVTITYFI